MEESSLVRPHRVILSTCPDSPWLVLINGLFVSKESWDSHIDYLNDKFNIVTYDCVGQAPGDLLKEKHTLEDHAHDLYKLLSFLKIENSYLLGLSNGGRIALKFSELYPKKVAKVIAIGIYNRLDTHIKNRLESWLNASIVGGHEQRFNLSKKWIFSEGYLKQNQEVINRYKEISFKKDKEIAEYLISNALIKEDYIDSNKISCPLILFSGEEDYLTPFDKHQLIAKDVPQAKAYKLKGGHACILEYPQNMKKIMEHLCLG